MEFEDTCTNVISEVNFSKGLCIYIHMSSKEPVVAKILFLYSNLYKLHLRILGMNCNKLLKVSRHYMPQSVTSRGSRNSPDRFQSCYTVFGLYF